MTANSQGQLTILMNNKWKLATDPLKIIDVTFGSAVVGKGAFVLYESTEGLNIQFRVFEGHDFSVEVAVPSGDAFLSTPLFPTYVDSDRCCLLELLYRPGYWLYRFTRRWRPDHDVYFTAVCYPR